MLCQRKGKLMTEREKVITVLKELGIAFRLEEHKAVFTIGEMEQLGLQSQGTVAKNLFLKDNKGKRHFLVVLPGDKKVDLKSLKGLLQVSGLSFASEGRLWDYLNLTKGAVTPLGIINNTAHDVEVIFDKELEQSASIGVHPNENTATVWLSYVDLVRFVEHHGNPLTVLEL